MFRVALRFPGVECLDQDKTAPRPGCCSLGTQELRNGIDVQMDFEILKASVFSLHSINFTEMREVG